MEAKERMSVGGGMMDGQAMTEWKEKQTIRTESCGFRIGRSKGRIK
jgi:hypothetical protein